MGYTTEFDGQITVEPPLNPAEIAHLNRFAGTRRMHRGKGPYYCGTGFAGQDKEADILDYNQNPTGQPNLWCQWIPTEDGTALEWNGGEKFYDSPEWMTYLINTFLKPGATLQTELANPIDDRYYAHEFAGFTFDHTCNGTIDAQGEEPDDRWQLVVVDNKVTCIVEPDRDALRNLVTAARAYVTHLRAIGYDRDVDIPVPDITVNLVEAVDALDEEEEEGNSPHAL